jgi:hypothetical protein
LAGTSIQDWEAQGLRASVFVRGAHDNPSMWQDLTGEKPETDEYRPREAQRLQGGAWQSGALEVQMSPGRIDVLYSPILSTGLMFTLGPFDTHSKAFANLVAPWIEKSTVDCVRLAFGAIVLARAENREAAYATLERYVSSVKYDATASREVSFRINRPVASRATNIEINRITNWTSVFIRRGLSAAGGTVPVQEDDLYFARLECDVSTPADRTELLQQELRVPIFLEMVEFARGNAARGELG